MSKPIKPSQKVSVLTPSNSEVQPSDTVASVSNNPSTIL